MTKKKLVYRGIIVSPFEKDTEEEALKVLNAIRMCHPEMDG